MGVLHKCMPWCAMLCAFVCAMLRHVSACVRAVVRHVMCMFVCRGAPCSAVVRHVMCMCVIVCAMVRHVMCMCVLCCAALVHVCMPWCAMFRVSACVRAMVRHVMCMFVCHGAPCYVHVSAGLRRVSACEHAMVCLVDPARHFPRGGRRKKHQKTVGKLYENSGKTSYPSLPVS